MSDRNWTPAQARLAVAYGYDPAMDIKVDASGRRQWAASEQLWDTRFLQLSMLAVASAAMLCHAASKGWLNGVLQYVAPGLQ